MLASRHGHQLILILLRRRLNDVMRTYICMHTCIFACEHERMLQNVIGNIIRPRNTFSGLYIGSYACLQESLQWMIVS